MQALNLSGSYRQNLAPNSIAVLKPQQLTICDASVSKDTILKNLFLEIIYHIKKLGQEQLVQLCFNGFMLGSQIKKTQLSTTTSVLSLSMEGSLVTIRAYWPYTLEGTPA